MLGLGKCVSQQWGKWLLLLSALQVGNMRHKKIKYKYKWGSLE